MGFLSCAYFGMTSGNINHHLQIYIYIVQAYRSWLCRLTKKTVSLQIHMILMQLGLQIKLIPIIGCVSCHCHKITFHIACMLAMQCIAIYT